MPMASICPLRAREFTSEPSMQECIGADCAWRELCGKERRMEPIVSHGIAAFTGVFVGMVLMALMAAGGRGDR